MLNFPGMAFHETSISEDDRLFAETWDGAIVGSVWEQNVKYSYNFDS